LLPTQEETYIDPTQILTSGLVGGSLFGRMGGGQGTADTGGFTGGYTPLGGAPMSVQNQFPELFNPIRQSSGDPHGLLQGDISSQGEFDSIFG
jgi:hypothetical protein